MGGQPAHYRVTTRHDLTPRQREVLALIASGHTNPEIAARLGISLEGAKHHVSEILSKLGVASREEAADWWRTNRESTVPRVLQALSSWPSAVAGAIAIFGVIVVVVAIVAGDGDEPPTAVTEHPPSCTDATVTVRREDIEAGSLYFTIQVSSPNAPCTVSGDVNLVPVDARSDHLPNANLGIRGSFSPRVESTVAPGGTAVAVLRWSNWCGEPFPIVWRPMTTIGNGPGPRPAPFVTDARPVCDDPAAPSKLERVDAVPWLERYSREVTDVCLAEDIRFELYEEAPWRPQAVLLEIRVSSARPCEVLDDLTVSLFIDATELGTAFVPFATHLDGTPLRAPFSWNGKCNPTDVGLEVGLGLAKGTLAPSIRPLCDPPATVDYFVAGWP